MSEYFQQKAIKFLLLNVHKPFQFSHSKEVLAKITIYQQEQPPPPRPHQWIAIKFLFTLPCWNSNLKKQCKKNLKNLIKNTLALWRLLLMFEYFLMVWCYSFLLELGLFFRPLDFDLISSWDFRKGWVRVTNDSPFDVVVFRFILQQCVVEVLDYKSFPVSRTWGLKFDMQVLKGS